jgi:glycosyltransferase involved in cell wall biosynthesis
MKICFWGSIARALKGTTDGGGELQIALLAKALTRCGHEIVIIDFQVPDDFVTEEGIKVFSIKGWNDGIRMIRTFTHRLPLLYKSLKNQKADIYYCRIRDFRHILAYWAARRVKAKFILQMASDLDAMNFRMRLKHYYVSNPGDLWWLFNGLLVEIVYPWLLRKADLVLVQHKGQEEILKNRNIKSRILLNLFNTHEIPCIPDHERKAFIYVGWLDKRKGFVEFYEVVKKSPNCFFKIVGPPRDSIGFTLFEKLKSFPNVTLFGELNHYETLKQIACSKALISTSPMEGFPNIFIEAWACGIPVISLNVDPGSTIEDNQLGVVAHGNINTILQTLNSLGNIDNNFSDRAKAYVENNHVVNTQKMKEINDLFCKVYMNGRETDQK